MLIPAPNSDWWLFIRAACAIVLAMAGGFPCCCSEPDGSGTSSQPPPPTSTSTSTSTPPLPPEPPGSTSTQPPVDPPRRSSSVGQIAYSQCDCCRDGGLVPDQWQIEVTMSEDAPPACAPSVEVGNGVYIVDGVNHIIEAQYFACSTAQMWGCGGGGTGLPNVSCPDARVNNGWSFIAAGVTGRSVNAVVDVIAEFSASWKGPFGATCNGPWPRFRHTWKANAAKAAGAPVLCSSVTNDADLPDCSAMDEIVMDEISSGYSGSAVAFTITGF